MLKITDEEIDKLSRMENNKLEIEYLAKKQLKSLNTEEIEKLGKSKRTSMISAFVSLITFSVIYMIIAIAGIIINYQSNFVLPLVISFICLLIGFCVVKPKELKNKDNSYWALKYLKQELKNKVSSVENERNRNIKRNRFYEKEIKYTEILDAYTEYSDKLHAFLNYQEIIQTRIYKFKVVYESGESEIVDIKEGTEEYLHLMKYINENKKSNGGQNIDITEEIRKYKKLYEDGIITQEEFEQKKKELLK